MFCRIIYDFITSLCNKDFVVTDWTFYRWSEAVPLVSRQCGITTGQYGGSNPNCILSGTSLFFIYFQQPWGFVSSSRKQPLDVTVATDGQTLSCTGLQVICSLARFTWVNRNCWEKSVVHCSSRLVFITVHRRDLFKQSPPNRKPHAPTRER